MKANSRLKILIITMIIAIAALMCGCDGSAAPNDVTSNTTEPASTEINIESSTSEVQESSSAEGGNSSPNNTDRTKNEQSTVSSQDATEATSQKQQASSGINDIGIDRAKALALSRVKGAKESNIVEIERDYDDGLLVYEGEIHFNGYEYEFEIDGSNGNILQWEIDD